MEQQEYGIDIQNELKSILFGELFLIDGNGGLSLSDDISIYSQYPGLHRFAKMVISNYDGLRKIHELIMSKDEISQENKEIINKIYEILFEQKYYMSYMISMFSGFGNLKLATSRKDIYDIIEEHLSQKVSYFDFLTYPILFENIKRAGGTYSIDFSNVYEMNKNSVLKASLNERFFSRYGFDTEKFQVIYKEKVPEFLGKLDDFLGNYITYDPSGLIDKLKNNDLSVGDEFESQMKKYMVLYFLVNSILNNKKLLSIAGPHIYDTITKIIDIYEKLFSKDIRIKLMGDVRAIQSLIIDLKTKDDALKADFAQKREELTEILKKQLEEIREITPLIGEGGDGILSSMLGAFKDNKKEIAEGLVKVAGLISNIMEQNNSILERLNGNGLNGDNLAQQSLELDKLQVIEGMLKSIDLISKWKSGVGNYYNSVFNNLFEEIVNIYEREYDYSNYYHTKLFELSNDINKIFELFVEAGVSDINGGIDKVIFDDFVENINMMSRRVNIRETLSRGDYRSGLELFFRYIREYGEDVFVRSVCDEFDIYLICRNEIGKIIDSIINGSDDDLVSDFKYTKELGALIDGCAISYLEDTVNIVFDFNSYFVDENSTVNSNIFDLFGENVFVSGYIRERINQIKQLILANIIRSFNSDKELNLFYDRVLKISSIKGSEISNLISLLSEHDLSIDISDVPEFKVISGNQGCIKIICLKDFVIKMRIFSDLFIAGFSGSDKLNQYFEKYIEDNIFKLVKLIGDGLRSLGGFEDNYKGDPDNYESSLKGNIKLLNESINNLMGNEIIFKILTNKLGDFVEVLDFNISFGKDDNIVDQCTEYLEKVKIIEDTGGNFDRLVVGMVNEYLDDGMRLLRGFSFDDAKINFEKVRDLLTNNKTYFSDFSQKMENVLHVLSITECILYHSNFVKKADNFVSNKEFINAFRDYKIAKEILDNINDESFSDILCGYKQNVDKKISDMVIICKDLFGKLVSECVSVENSLSENNMKLLDLIINDISTLSSCLTNPLFMKSIDYIKQFDNYYSTIIFFDGMKDYIQWDSETISLYQGVKSNHDKILSELHDMIDKLETIVNISIKKQSFSGVLNLIEKIKLYLPLSSSNDILSINQNIDGIKNYLISEMKNVAVSLLNKPNANRSKLMAQLTLDYGIPTSVVVDVRIKNT